jgi:hypothetical protein
MNQNQAQILKPLIDRDGYGFTGAIFEQFIKNVNANPVATGELQQFVSSHHGVYVPGYQYQAGDEFAWAYIYEQYETLVNAAQLGLTPIEQINHTALHDATPQNFYYEGSDSDADDEYVLPLSSEAASTAIQAAANVGITGAASTAGTTVASDDPLSIFVPFHGTGQVAANTSITETTEQGSDGTTGTAGSTAEAETQNIRISGSSISPH